MTVESSLMSFVHRVNDAFITSQTVHDLINDSDYQKLVIKNGKAAGVPLGNRHILPGYWFTVFVAPYESFKRVLDSVKQDEEAKKSALEKNENLTEEDIEVIQAAIQKFKDSAGSHELQPLIETFRKEIDTLVQSIDKLDTNSKNNFPKENTLKRFTTSIASGSYEFSNDDDLKCTFYDNDALFGYRFESTVKVADFNQLAVDFSQQLVKLLWPIVENNKTIRSEVSRLFIGEIFLQEF